MRGWEEGVEGEGEEGERREGEEGGRKGGTKKVRRREGGREGGRVTYLEATDHHVVFIAGVVGHRDDSEWNGGSAQSLCGMGGWE